jgi:hypothetical protein
MNAVDASISYWAWLDDVVRPRNPLSLISMNPRIAHDICVLHRPPMTSEDVGHPNDAGHAMMATAFDDVLIRAIAGVIEP